VSEIFEARLYDSGPLELWSAKNGIITALLQTQFNDSQTSNIAAGYGNSGALFSNQSHLHENEIGTEVQCIIHANNNSITALACGSTQGVIGV
jgi:hypothetical protein